MISLLQNTGAMAANGLTTYFSAVGGTSPYTYSVLPNGAGGTIDPVSGLYTSPSDTGIDIISVVDAASNSTTATIEISTPLQLVCDIIQTQMNLSQGQVYLWDQKLFIPTDDRLYVAVGVLSCKPFGNSNTIDSNGNSLQVASMQATVSIDILSRGPDARDRKEQVLLALNSNYAESQQELNSFYIGKLSQSFVNLSEIDGPAIPYRFNISFLMQYFVSITQAVPYFSQFSKPEVITDP
jgi:hypothetical protein